MICHSSRWLPVVSQATQSSPSKVLLIQRKHPPCQVRCAQAKWRYHAVSHAVRPPIAGTENCKPQNSVLSSVLFACRGNGHCQVGIFLVMVLILFSLAFQNRPDQTLARLNPATV